MSHGAPRRGRDVSLFDRFARLYELAMPPADRETLERALAHAERPVERAVEVGGGTGRAARLVDATVVDAAPGMVREARRRGVDGLLGDASRLPLRDDSVDAVLVVDALHHFPSHVAAIGEAARVLAPGGVLVVREFDPTTLRGRALVAAERAVGFDSRFHSPDALAGVASRAGLAPTVTERGFAYTLVATKPAAERGE